MNLKRLVPSVLACCMATVSIQAEEPVIPAPTPSVDEQRLKELADELLLLQNGNAAAAEHHHQKGLEAMRQARLNDAIQHLTRAVDYAPDNKQYTNDLRKAQAIAGKSRDSRDLVVNDIIDRRTVADQSIWVEISSLVEEGQAYLADGQYQLAQSSFDRAHVRLNSLNFNDERREMAIRQVEKLVSETKERRSQAELEGAQRDIREANLRMKEVRQYEFRLERQRIDALLSRALKARDRRNYDETILLCEQILKENPAESRAHELLVRARRERHVYLRQITGHQWDEQHRLLSEEIRKAMLPQFEVVRYSDNWDEIDRRRTAAVQNVGGADQVWRKELNDQLERQLTLEFVDAEIADVISFLQQNTGINIVLDSEVISSGDVAPITMRVSDIKLKNALDFIMTLSGLHYAIQDEAVYISSEEGVRGDAVMRIYDIADMTNPTPDFPGPKMQIPEPGDSGSSLQAEIVEEDDTDIDYFIDLIQAVVAVDAWDDDGVGIEDHNGQMVVTQTSDVHAEIDNLLRTLRNQRGIQISVSVKWLDVDDTTLEKIGFDWNNYTGPVDPAGLGSTRPLNLGYYWSDPDNLGIGTVNTTTLGGFYEATGFGNPTGEGFQGHFQYFNDPTGLISSTLIEAVEKSNKSNVSIEPNLTLFNGQRAHLVNLTQQAYVADYDVVGSQFDPIISILSHGTVLDVSAIASADRKYVTLTLRPTSANLDQFRTFRITDGGIQGVVQGSATFGQGSLVDFPLTVPIMNFRSLETTSTIPDGGSMLVAGLTNSSSNRAHQGIPFLSHIPFLGRLFSTNGRSEVERKTIITVSADIVLFDELEEEL